MAASGCDAAGIRPEGPVAPGPDGHVPLKMRSREEPDAVVQRAAARNGRASTAIRGILARNLDAATAT